MIEVSISFTSPETRAIISPSALPRKAQRKFRYLAVDLIADVADDTRTDRDHRNKKTIYIVPTFKKVRHDQENSHTHHHIENQLIIFFFILVPEDKV